MTHGGEPDPSTTNTQHAPCSSPLPAACSATDPLPYPIVYTSIPSPKTPYTVSPTWRYPRKHHTP